VSAMMEDADVLAFLREQARITRFVTSVCTGALVLGAAGLLRGRRATTHWASHDLLSAFGAIPTKGRVVRDGNLITGGGVTAGIDFALTMVAEIAGSDVAQAIQLQIEHAPAPPFDAGTPETAPPHVLSVVRQRNATTRTAREALIRGITRESGF
jgi:cyclohexyl-isocyanide hydratase